MGSGFSWAPGQAPSDLARRIEEQYGVSRHVAAAGALAERWGPVLEAFAKAHAPWQDRTANARQSLFHVVDVQPERVILYLSHGVEYGVFLELRWQGKWAIILPALQAHYQAIMQSVRDLYR